MVDIISIINESTNQLINFGKDETFKVLLDTNGINWGSPSAAHNYYSNVNQVGVNITSSQVEPRTISITGYIWSGLQKEDKDYINMSQEDFDKERNNVIYALKQKLSKLINPLDTIKVEVGNFFIEGKPTSSVVFSNKWSENNEIYCKFTFSIYCPDPMFKKNEGVSTVLSGSSGSFHFPLVLKEEGNVFGVKISYQLIFVENAGDVVTGGKIIIKAVTGEVINPVITNIYSEENIVINKTLNIGESLIIDTEERDIYIESDKGIENAFVYWDFENDWIQFQVGANLIGYSADDESYKNLEASIVMNERLYSIGEQ